MVKKSNFQNRMTNLELKSQSYDTKYSGVLDEKSNLENKSPNVAFKGQFYKKKVEILTFWH